MNSKCRRVHQYEVKISSDKHMQGNQLSFSLKHTYSMPHNFFKQGVRICICCDGSQSGLNGLLSNTVQKWVLHEKRLRIF